MAKKKQKQSWMTMLIVLAVVVLGYQAGVFDFFLGALIPNEQFNGDMEDWCIIPENSGEGGFGWLNGGATRCNDANSVPYLADYYDGTHHTNMLPLMWKNKYGCCVARTTDAYEGEYAALVHKESKDDWYAFGLTKDDGSGTLVPAIAGRTYTMSFYYKYHLTSGRDFSMNMKFYDNSRVEISEGRVSRGFTEAATYTNMQLTGIAPPNTAYVTWNFWIPDDSVVDLTMDSMTIDESDPCPSPGATQECGTNLGVCSYGTMTCQADGNWAACAGAVTPTPDLCGDGLDNDCDGEIDEFCDMEAFTQTELVEKFDWYNTWHDGWGTINSNDVTWWTWDNAPITEAYVNMYEATGDTRFLDYFIANTDVLISKASDSDSNGLLDWNNVDSYNNDINLDYTRNSFPLVKFAYSVKKDNLGAYMAKANEYQSFVETNIVPLWDDEWRECGEFGFWGEGSRSAPNNRIAHGARTYVYLWLIDGNAEYYDKAERYAKKVKSTLELRSDGPTGAQYYFWHYNDETGCVTHDDGSQTCSYDCATDQTSCPTGGWMCNGPMEIWYGAHDVALMLDFYEAGIVFDGSDVTRLQNTFKEGLLVSDAEAGGVHTPVLKETANYEDVVDWRNKLYAGTAIKDWTRLGQYDSTIQDVAAQIVHFTVSHNEQENDFYTRPYACVNDLRDLTVPELCEFDEDNGRSTPANSMLAVSILARGSETLRPLGETCTPSVSCEYSEWSDTVNDCGSRTEICIDTNGCISDTVVVETAECPITEPPTFDCGNGVVETGETCDGVNFDGQTCETLGFERGVLFCLPEACAFDTAHCTDDRQNDPICHSIWQCTDWKEGTGVKTRTCDDLNNCEPSTNDPALTIECADCVAKSNPLDGIDKKWLYLAGLALVAFLIVGQGKKKK